MALQHSPSFAHGRRVPAQHRPSTQLSPQHSVHALQAPPFGPQHCGWQVFPSHRPLQQSRFAVQASPVWMHGAAQVLSPFRRRGWPFDALPRGPSPRGFAAATRNQKKRPAAGFSAIAACEVKGAPTCPRRQDSSPVVIRQCVLRSSPR
jgi:hypothetical protein